MSRIVVKCDKCKGIGICDSNCDLIHEAIDAMIELKQKDIIEYGLKLSQFKNQLEQKRRSNQQEKNQVRCPRCGSANITAGQRGYSLLTGFVGSGSTVNRCANCGHKWKP